MSYELANAERCFEVSAEPIKENYTLRLSVFARKSVRSVRFWLKILQKCNICLAFASAIVDCNFFVN